MQLLGWWEAAAIPVYSVVTISFYRRSEQPLRVAAWYGASIHGGEIFLPRADYGREQEQMGWQTSYLRQLSMAAPEPQVLPLIPTKLYIVRSPLLLSKSLRF